MATLSLLALIGVAPRAAAAEYPSWSDVETSRSNETAKQTQIAALKNLIAGLTTEVAAARDLDTDKDRALAARNGSICAPGILIDGVMFSYGRLSEKKLRHHLSRSALDSPEQPGSDRRRLGLAAHHDELPQ